MAKTRSGKRCTHNCVDGFNVCRMHGGAGARKALKPGNLSTQQLTERKQFLDALRGENEEDARLYIKKVRETALGGSETMLRYVLDQLYGGPKTTVEVQIGDKEMIALMIRVTARHLKTEAFEAWLSDFNQALQLASGSKNS